jgi:peptidyl-prolyl cis-trans isomerase C
MMKSAALSRLIRALCVVAFASVAASALLPTLSHAAGEFAPADLPPAGQPSAPPASPSAAVPPRAAAVVNGVAIPQSELDAAVRAAGSQASMPDTPQLRSALRQQLIAHELLRQAAVRAHYDTRPEVQQAAPNDKVNVAIQLWLSDNVHPAPVSAAQMKARYRKLIASMGSEEYKVHMIALADEATATMILTALNAGQPFDALARQYGVGTTKTNGGAMPWVSFKTPVTEGNTNVPLPLAQAITQLQPGETMTRPVAVGNMWVVLRLDGKRATHKPSFDEAKPEIQQQLQAEAAQSAVGRVMDTLARQASIQL